MSSSTMAIYMVQSQLGIQFVFVKNIKRVIELLQYHKHNWIICVDLKMVCFLLGQQRGYTKYPCFLCMWDSRAREKHWVERNWPTRSDLKPGDPNILHEPLVNRKKIIFPPLHIKLGLMKQFVKALPNEGDCLKYLILAFPGLSIEKSRPVCLMVHRFGSSSKMNISSEQCQNSKKCLVII